MFRPKESEGEKHAVGTNITINLPSYMPLPSQSSSNNNPSWRNWLARQTVNLEVVSSTLTEGDCSSFCDLFMILLFLSFRFLTFCSPLPDLVAKAIGIASLPGRHKLQATICTSSPFRLRAAPAWVPEPPLLPISQVLGLFRHNGCLQNSLLSSHRGIRR